MKRPGLRLQILLALAGVMLVAYVPLFFAIAQVTRATSLAYREDAARSLGRAIATQVADATDRERVLARYVGDGSAIAIGVFESGSVAGKGPPEELARMQPAAKDGSTRTTTADGQRALDIASMSKGLSIVVRVRTEDDRPRTAQLVKGIALYMTVFALALLVFAYIALTRAIVRPIEELARATDRIASGARRDIDLPASGAREVADLGASVREMTARLLEEEQKLRDKVDELTQTTRSLGETREQLAGSEHMASVGKLAAGVAHEIGNPIAAIMGMHDLLDEANEDTRVDFLKRMRKETERIHTVVRDLLDYARPDNDPLSSAAVGEVIDDALALVRPQRGFKGVTVNVESPGTVNVALAPQRLTQVLLNLLLNAGAALDGSGTVTIRVTKDESKARIEIEDDGPGVPNDLAPRIFDPFVTTKDVGAGTGLGLAVCRGIIEGAKGRIFLDASFTKGARFVIELPWI
jgi:signal transduction histidine kinase